MIVMSLLYDPIYSIFDVIIMITGKKQNVESRDDAKITATEWLLASWANN